MKHLALDKRTELIKILRDSNVSEVRVSFDGSGDLGSVEYVGLYDSSGKACALDAAIEWPFRSSSWADGEWKHEITNKVVPIAEALENLCYDMLAQTGIDWYNNDGGFGELRIDVESGEVGLEVSTRYTEYNTFNFNQDCQEV